MTADLLTLYVIAGPNGIGKSTATFDAIPSTVPIINSDEIARLTPRATATNMQEWSNREAMRLVDVHLQQRTSFGIETNLADGETWKFLLEVQRSGYHLHLLFLCTDYPEVLNRRITERHRRGEHFVRPDIMRERYVNGLSLLKHYFDRPDSVQLFDNSQSMKLVAERTGEHLRTGDNLPLWAKEIISSRESKIDEVKFENLSSVEAVRLRYNQTRRAE